MIRKAALAVALGFAALVPGAVWADQIIAVPQPWQMNLQPPATPGMEQIVTFHTNLLYVITAITLFVLGLLLYIMFRFNAKANPTPTKTSHNTVLEILWTVVPIIILVGIAIPSFKLLFFTGRVPPDAAMTLKVTGHQWYWSYVYPDQGGFGFDSIIKCRTDEECAGYADASGKMPLRLLDVDNRIVLPVGTIIRVQITGDDVIHSWAVPSFGVKTDAVPGRLQETWIEIEHEGLYYGQCSELCGVDHGFMPITVEAVSKQAFEDWVKKAQVQFKAENPRGPKEVAQVQTR